MILTKEQIKEITNKAHQPCLIGMRAFDQDIQQFTCKSFNGEYCDCYKKYKAALEKETNSTVKKT